MHGVEALALDPQGRPRFVLHTYRATLGIGQSGNYATSATSLSYDQSCPSALPGTFEYTASDASLVVFEHFDSTTYVLTHQRR